MRKTCYEKGIVIDTIYCGQNILNTFSGIFSLQGIFLLLVCKKIISEGLAKNEAEETGNSRV
jgi:hypothetical protein